MESGVEGQSSEARWHSWPGVSWRMARETMGLAEAALPTPSGTGMTRVGLGVRFAARETEVSGAGLCWGEGVVLADFILGAGLVFAECGRRARG